MFEAGLENCVDNPYLLQAFAVMEEQRGNQAKVKIQKNIKKKCTSVVWNS